MKEATGELNVTVIVVTIVAMLSLFFFSYLWPRIKGNFNAKTRCDDAICICPAKDSDGNCIIPDNGMVECHIKGNPNEKIMCTWKG